MVYYFFQEFYSNFGSISKTTPILCYVFSEGLNFFFHISREKEVKNQKYKIGRENQYQVIFFSDCKTVIDEEKIVEIVGISEMCATLEHIF